MGRAPISRRMSQVSDSATRREVESLIAKRGCFSPHFPDETVMRGTRFAPDPMKTGVFHQIVPF
jgi:hypothetical protein